METHSALSGVSEKEVKIYFMYGISLVCGVEVHCCGFW